MTYYKFIGDRMVFSTCKVITLDGHDISNPSAEQIASAGWLPYVPPVVPETEPDYESVIAAVKKFLSTETDALSDEDALAVAALYPTWLSKVEKAEQDGTGVAVGERLWYNEKLYKVIQAHVPQRTWAPDQTPALYTEVSIVEWPEWVQPTGAQDAYMTGDKVSHNGSHWESSVDNNTWEPGIYGWSEQA